MGHWYFEKKLEEGIKTRTVSGHSHVLTDLHPGNTRYQLYRKWLGTRFWVHFENTSVFLLVRGKNQIQSKIPTKYMRFFLVFCGPCKQMLKENFDSCQYHYCQCPSHVTTHCHPGSHCYIVFSYGNHLISYQYRHNNHVLADYYNTYLPTYLLT